MKGGIKGKTDEIRNKIKETEREVREDKKSTEDLLSDAVSNFRQKQKESEKK